MDEIQLNIEIIQLWENPATRLQALVAAQNIPSGSLFYQVFPDNHLNFIYAMSRPKSVLERCYARSGLPPICRSVKKSFHLQKIAQSHKYQGQALP